MPELTACLKISINAAAADLRSAAAGTGRADGGRHSAMRYRQGAGQKESGFFGFDMLPAGQRRVRYVRGQVSPAPFISVERMFTTLVLGQVTHAFQLGERGQHLFLDAFFQGDIDH